MDGGNVTSGHRVYEWSGATLGFVANRVYLDAMRSHWQRFVALVRTGDLSLGAGAVAFHTFLALMPLGAALLGAAAVVGGDSVAVARIERALDPVAPAAVRDFVTGLLTDSDRRIDGEWWLITVSAVAALFLGARAVMALQRGLAFATGYATRIGPSRRLAAMALTVAGGATLLVSGTLLVAGRSLFVFFAGWSGREVLVDLWRWLRIPVAASGLFGFILLCYRHAAPVPLPNAVAAAVAASIGVIGGSLGFGFYLSHAARFGAAFGTLGAVAAMLGWLYIAAWSILASAAVLGTEDAA